MYTLWGSYTVNMLLDVIHLVCSRPMTLHHVISHVTTVTCLFIINKKKEIQKKRNIKSRKIDKRKRKMFSPHMHHNTVLTINNPTLISIHCPWVYHMYIMRWTYHRYVPWYYSSSLFFQSLGLWPHIMWHFMWP